jgi:hypothetical protein
MISVCVTGMAFSIPISGVCERDIDLLLLEEFITSFDFCQWFVDQVMKPESNVECLLNARRSVTQSSGESDLEILLRDSDGNQVQLLIENKVNANLQPQQAERYQLRGQSYLEQGNCAKFCTVIVAPKRYFSSDDALKGFHSRVTYEAIQEWFSNQELGERKRYKEALLKAAIEKGTLGYQVVADAPVTDFWQMYWQLVKEYAPELEMKEPGAKPAGSNFIYFRPVGLPKEVDIVHKLPHGKVDLQFRKMGEQVSELKHQFEGDIESDMCFAKAGKSGCIRLRVPTVNTSDNFVEQKRQILEGVFAAQRLLEWYLQLKPCR